jgi:hypothetical protein
MCLLGSVIYWVVWCISVLLFYLLVNSLVVLLVTIVGWV